MGVITGATNIENVRLLTLRHRLKLEIKGIRFKGRTSGAIIRDVLMCKTMNRKKLLGEFEEFLVTQRGLELCGRMQ